MLRPVSDASVSAPPDDPDELVQWAEAHHIAGRLDDLLIAPDGPPGTILPSREGERLTYRDVLTGAPPTSALRRQWLVHAETARAYLHRMAQLVARHRAVRAFMDEHGRTPDDPVLAAFLSRLIAEQRAHTAAHETPPRRGGTFEPVRVRPVRDPKPTLRYLERPLVGWRGSETADMPEIAVLLLGWEDAPLRWAFYRADRALDGDVPVDQQLSALAEMIDFVRDPERGDEQAELGELLQLRAWQYALSSLDERLARLGASLAGSRGPADDERIAYRVVPLPGGALGVEPMVQKRQARGGYSKGARLEWFHLADRRDLAPADKRALAAYDDRLARRTGMWRGHLTAAQVFGILHALADHPAVFLAGHRDDTARVDIRQGRLRLRFVRAIDGALAPQFDLLGVPLLPAEANEALRDGRYLLHLHRPQAAPPQVVLAELRPEAAALVQALAIAPARFPPEAHDALAVRLEDLQETIDIEFPSEWTRTIADADRQTVVRLEVLGSGAIAVELGVRPVRHGPLFAPGEGPTMVLEGQGRDRHGVRRDRAGERQAASALADQLGLGEAQGETKAESQPWRWRVAAGDLAFALVDGLRDLTEQANAEVAVEWADDEQLLAMGSVGRRDLRLKVADDRDWFAVQGGAKVDGKVVPLSDLLVAIREGRRYVPVGSHGFVRIDEALRAALTRAQGGFSGGGWSGNGDAEALRLATVVTDPLYDLVEDEAQIEASAALAALRRRMREGTQVTPRLSAALASTLRPYQAAGVAWLTRLAHWSAGALLADEMGLGKTLQTLAVLYHRAALGPALVVAPTSVVANWAAEAARFVPELRVTVYRGRDRGAALVGLGAGDLVLTSYGIATLDAEALTAIPFASLVLDEAQAIKNATTERARALRALKADWRLALTGTPIENALAELWSLFRVVSPGLLGSWEYFRAVYAVPIEKFGDSRRQKTLAALLQPFVLRRTKAEAAPELPERTDIVRVVRLSPEELALYEQLRASLLQEIAEAKKDPNRDAGNVLRFNLLAAITRLRQLCCHPRLVYPRADAGSSKAGYLLDLLGELRQAGHRTLVFSQFRSFLEIVAPRIRRAGLRVVTLDGTTPAEARADRVAAFQAGAADVFLISLKAGGFGLNLTAADTVIHLDPWWNPAVEDQATARAHRIGQTRPVTAIRLVAQGTIEEAVLGLHAAKRALAAGVLDGSELAASLSTDELLTLIRQGARAGDADD
jgi:hypothetical protein